jgi:Tol biopolymer transport system component
VLPLAFLLGACTGPGYRLADLPSEPLAVVVRSREESQHRAETIARAEEGHRQQYPDKQHFELEILGDYLGLGRSRHQKIGDMLGRLALLDARTGEPEILDFAPRGARPLAWSKDRRLLLYMAAPGGVQSQQIFEYDRHSGEVRRLAGGPHNYVGASYGPEGRLALARFDPRKGGDAQLQIFVTRPGGAAPHAVTEGPQDTWPVWSPDGSVLLYTSVDEVGEPVIRAIDPLSGGGSRVLARGLMPAFSPKGDWVVYTARRRGRWALWRIRPDGTGRRPIGDSAHNESHPTVSPDGRFVAFVVEKDEHQRLMVRPIEGSGDRPLLKTGDGLLPRW